LRRDGGRRRRDALILWQESKKKRCSGFVARRIGGHGGGCIDYRHNKLCAEVRPATVLGQSAFLREQLELLLAHGVIH